MFFARRSRTASSRYLSVRVGLFFLAAGVWLAGVAISDQRVTFAAIVLLLVAFLLGFVGRERVPDDGGSLEDEESSAEESS